MKEQEWQAVLMLDEIRFCAGHAFDQMTGTVDGRPTIPLADGSLPHGAIAMHGLVFMLAGITERWKQTAAYHLTGNSFSSASVRGSLIGVIQACEKTGIRTDAVVGGTGGGRHGVVVRIRHSYWEAFCRKNFLFPSL